MSQRIHFWYQINITENVYFLGEKNLGQATNNNFELKMPKLLETHVRSKLQDCLSHCYYNSFI